MNNCSLLIAKVAKVANETFYPTFDLVIRDGGLCRNGRFYPSPHRPHAHAAIGTHDRRNCRAILSLARLRSASVPLVEARHGTVERRRVAA